jgi:hypothetical protein
VLKIVNFIWIFSAAIRQKRMNIMGDWQRGFMLGHGGAHQGLDIIMKWPCKWEAATKDIQILVRMEMFKFSNFIIAGAN